ncbi:MAG: WYL domain-containing protein [Steroidobacteraceae bacterium]|nr:WYL domain-containing protein [Steroidobacteraceae bacterium]
MIHYRETWYLDAWDELRDALRTFSIDRIRKTSVLEEVAPDLPGDLLNEHFATAYGIFGGEADQVAVLKFTTERSR